MPRIIDSHSHYMPPEVAQNTSFFKQQWSDANKQLALMDQLKIEKAVLLYPTSDAHLQMGGWKNLCAVYNPKIVELVNKFSGRFIGAGILPVDSPAEFIPELNRIQDLGLQMISLASSYDGKYLDDPIFEPVFEMTQRQGMAIHVHPQIMNPIGSERLNDPLLSPVLEYVFDVSVALGRLMMNGVFDKYPQLNFIFAHYGGVLPFVKERFDTTYQMLRRRNFVKDLGRLPSEYFRNLYFDMSGSKSPAALQAVLELTDASHILWGSDFPANQNFDQSMATVRESGLSQNEKSRIMAGNIDGIISNVLSK